MATIETRLSRLETVQQEPRRQYSDTERAIRYAHLQEKGGPDADKARALLEKIPEDNHEHP